MKKRLAKKILQCKSTLSRTNWNAVLEARKRMKHVRGWIILPLTYEEWYK